MVVQDFLPFIVIGLTAGSVYGLAGTGLVLTYKTSGVFNFAYGAIAAVAAYVFYWLHVQRRAWPGRSPRVLCLFVLGPADGPPARAAHPDALAGGRAVPDRRHDRPRRSGSLALLTLWGNTWSERTRSSSSPTSSPPRRSRSADVNVGYNQLITMVHRAPLGHRVVPVLPMRPRSASSMRAVVDDPDLVNIAGTNPITRAPLGVDHRHHASRRCPGCCWCRRSD